MFKFHFGCISKRPDILMHFISGSVYMIFYRKKWNFISVKMTDIKSIPAMSFKRTCALNATSNESTLIHFVSGKLCSHENLMPVWNFILAKMKSVYMQAKNWKTKTDVKIHLNFFEKSSALRRFFWKNPPCYFSLSPENIRKPKRVINQL